MNWYSIKYFILSVLAAVFLSCTGLETVEGGIAGTNGSWNVSASLNTGEITRISEISNLLYWQDGDEVAFRAVSGSSSPVTSDQTILTLNKLDSGLGTAKFKGTVIMGEQPSECYFAYPSSSQISGSGSVTFDFAIQDGRIHSPYLYGAAAYDASGINCVLKHAAALIRLNVPSGVTKVEVSANSLTNDKTFDMATQKISKVIVGQDGTISVLDDAIDKITVTVDPSKLNYIFVPAINFVDGFSFYMETSEGEIIVKSYSVDGGKYSDYNFEPGSVIDLDYSGENAPTPLDISCVLSEIQNHDVKDGLLTGTTVSIQSFIVEGVPAKVIDAWGVAVYDGDAETGTMVRWVNGSGSFNSPGQPLAVYNDWPLLLPEKTYNVYAVCQINGRTHYVHSGRLYVPELPSLTLGLQAETSYTIFRSPQGGASAANDKDGNTIYGVSSSVNISPTLLNNSKYGFSLEVKAEGQTPKSHTWTYASNNSKNVYTLGNWEALSVGNYTLKGSMTFAGRITNATDLSNLAITGLPYKGNPPSSVDWSVSNGDYEFGTSYLQLGDDSGVSATSTITAKFTRSFYVPASIDASLNIKARIFAVKKLITFNHDYIVYFNNNSIISQNSDGQTSGKDYEWTEDVQLTQSPSIRIDGAKDSAGLKSYTYYVNLLYR